MNKSHITHLKTPDKFIVTNDIADSAEFIKNIFARRSSSISIGDVEVLGLEIRQAYDEVRNISDSCKISNYKRKCIGLLFRPAIEVGILSYWEHLINADANIEVINKMVNIMVGHPVSISKWAMTIKSGKGRVVFESPEYSQNWISDIYNARKSGMPLHLLAIFAYTRTILAHPFSDGNGRLARAIFQIFMSESVGWKVPGIALAPATYKHIPLLQRSLKEVGTTNNWNSIAFTLKKIVVDADKYNINY